MGPWAFGVPLILGCALGLLINIYVLFVVVGLGKQTQQQQTANTLLLIHLGAVEAAVCLILLIFTTTPWPVPGGSWCVFNGFLLALLHPVALWTVTGLNCDRYYAIAAPLHYTALVSPKRVIVGLVASWTGAILLCLPPFSGLVPPYRYSPGLGCCAPDFGNGSWGTAAALYGAIYAILGLALPAILVTVCNLRVLGIARYHRHRIASAIYEVTLSAQVTITHQRNPFFVPTVTAPSAGGPPRFHSAASTVMQLVGSLYLLYFPYCGFILWESCGAGNQNRVQAHPRLASLASLLLAYSPPINGLLYGLKSQTLRRSVQNYWRKKATKSELQQEIQARTPSVAGSRRPSGSGTVGSFFPFPPLQRRLSEALLAIGNCRSGNSIEQGNIQFHRTRLQPAASCNTLRVPSMESGESGKLVRSSASAASLMGPHYRGDFPGNEIGTNRSISTNETPRRSPRILITRACSEESQDGGSPLRKSYFPNSAHPPCENGDIVVPEAIVVLEVAKLMFGQLEWHKKMGKNNVKNMTDIWPTSRRLIRVKTLEEDSLSIGIRPNNNSESSDTTDTTATTTTTTLPIKTGTLEEDEEETNTRRRRKESRKKEDRVVDQSESENSWSSSVEEIEMKQVIEKNKIVLGDEGDDGVGEEDRLKSRKSRRKKRITPCPSKDSEDRDDDAQLRPLLTPSS
ncbi:hypothetical protein M0802_007191 [Mischocyttarus mexicanus]|nr:hypothetical protein M0802_007191 [Mischocyttarus mexicanus]